MADHSSMGGGDYFGSKPVLPSTPTTNPQMPGQMPPPSAPSGPRWQMQGEATPIPTPTPYAEQKQSRFSGVGKVLGYGLALRWVIAGALFLGGGVVAWFTSADRDSSGAIVDSGTVEATELRVGDCFDDPDSEGVFFDVHATPCTEPHDNEVIHVFTMAGGAFPSDIAFFNQAEAECLPRFTSYVGVSFEVSPTLDLTLVTPSEEGWKQGDHKVLCIVYNLDFEKLTRSVRGMGFAAS